MPIYGFRLQNVGPFDDMWFEFDEHVNVLVGPNNCGKTCALMALANATVYRSAFSTKFLRAGQEKRKAEFKVVYGQSLWQGPTYAWPLPLESVQVQWADPDWAKYSAYLSQIGYSAFVPALRLSTSFRSEGPAANLDQEWGARWQEESKWRWEELSAREQDTQLHLTRARKHEVDHKELGRRARLPRVGAFLARDRSLVQTIVNLDYRGHRESKPAIQDVIRRIGVIASEIADGFPIEYLGVHEDDEGLYPKFKTRDGDLPLNCLSQGTQSVIQWLGYFLLGYAEYYGFPDDLAQRPATLIIDDVDAHLHPSWQRRIIPKLRQHFPNLQFFCATHSPLMLAGVKAGQVQLLKRNEDGKVVVSRSESDIVGWSADEILRSFLDVRDPTDLATSEDIRRLQELRGKEKLTEGEARELEELRQKVSEELLGGPLAGEVAQLGELLARSAAEGEE